jgi:hypothetical protein
LAPKVPAMVILTRMIAADATGDHGQCVVE